MGKLPGLVTESKTVEVPLGTAVAGRYVITRPLARGGISTVYQAVDVQACRRLAIKIVDERYSHLIRHEAAITARLRHPHVPKLYDVGFVTDHNGRPAGYLALELLVGQPLDHALASGPMHWPNAIQIAGTAADVLAVAHRRGIVHRDLTPGNVVLTARGTKIVDFGLAAVIDGSARTSDDVYALGALLYQTLTGRSAYQARSKAGPRSASALRCLAPTPVLGVPGLPSRVTELCRELMSKNPLSRPSAKDAALALWSMC